MERRASLNLEERTDLGFKIPRSVLVGLAFASIARMTGKEELVMAPIATCFLFDTCFGGTWSYSPSGLKALGLYSAAAIIPNVDRVYDAVKGYFS